MYPYGPPDRAAGLMPYAAGAGQDNSRGPHVSRSGSDSSDTPHPGPPPLSPAKHTAKTSEAPFTCDDFEPPRSDAPTYRGEDSGDLKRHGPSSPDYTSKKPRLLAASMAKDGQHTLSPTLTFASRCDSFKGAISATGLPTDSGLGMSFGMPGNDAQLLHSWSGSLGGGSAEFGDPLKVCFDGWNAPQGVQSSTSQQRHTGTGRQPNMASSRSPLRSSWDEPIPLDESKRWSAPHPQNMGGGNMQGSFGYPAMPAMLPRLGMSGEFRGADHKTQPYSMPSMYGMAPSFGSPHGQPSQRRDDIEQFHPFQSPRGGWSHGPMSPPGHHHMDDRRDPSPYPTFMGHPHQGHHHYGGNMYVNSVAGQLHTPDGVLLLAMQDDRVSLSETLSIVRENVEVFCATEADVKAPAPGRKRPVSIGQIGLRCIHCRHVASPGDRVKRAICYPSSIKRIYRTVIDMKLDHFKSCRFVPADLKEKLDELKATNGRSTGTTMAYFVNSAKKMGMVDGATGVIYDPAKAGEVNGKRPAALIQQDSQSPGQPNRSTYHTHPGVNGHAAINQINSKASSFDRQLGRSGSSSGSHLKTIPMNGSGSSLSMNSFGGPVEHSQGKIIINDGSDTPYTFFTGSVPLGVEEDENALSPLRCFLRRHVCAFSATKQDIACRTPTSFPIAEGQVGIGCVHCYGLPAKKRSNRALCFPFSVGRIYQAVADIQRFHFHECKMIPQEVKDEFLALQNASSKGSKGLATRQYWITSAKKLGLADTDQGIRFIRDPMSQKETPAFLDILARVASDVTTQSKPLVCKEDKPFVAEFLYTVMEQLQPCRFTEADRNKRRMKEVGATGVECKHCAGKADSRKFFWASVNAVESNFVSVHNHMMECKHICQETKDQLAHFKTLRKEQTAKLKTGSQKKFFIKVWERLHSQDEKTGDAQGSNSPPQQLRVKQKHVQEFGQLPPLQRLTACNAVGDPSQIAMVKI